MKGLTSQLTTRALIQKKQETPDGYGGTTSEWVNVQSAWMGIFPLSARELLVAEQARNQITHRIIMRYWTGLGESAGMVDVIKRGLRIVDGTDIYLINTVIIKADRYEIMTTQVAPS